jgi:hypothetical protein
MFDLGMFPPLGPFGRNFPTHCLGETPFETVSGKISRKWIKCGKHSQIELACGIFSSIWEKYPIEFFLALDFLWDS